VRDGQAILYRENLRFWVQELQSGLWEEDLSGRGTIQSLGGIFENSFGIGIFRRKKKKVG